MKLLLAMAVILGLAGCSDQFSCDRVKINNTTAVYGVTCKTRKVDDATCKLGPSFDRLTVGTVVPYAGTRHFGLDGSTQYQIKMANGVTGYINADDATIIC